MSKAEQRGRRRACRDLDAARRRGLTFSTDDVEEPEDQDEVDEAARKAMAGRGRGRKKMKGVTATG